MPPFPERPSLGEWRRERPDALDALAKLTDRPPADPPQLAMLMSAICRSG